QSHFAAQMSACDPSAHAQQPLNIHALEYDPPPAALPPLAGDLGAVGVLAGRGRSQSDIARIPALQKAQRNQINSVKKLRAGFTEPMRSLLGARISVVGQCDVTLPVVTFFFIANRQDHRQPSK